MIALYWLLPVFLLGGFFGFLTAAIMVAHDSDMTPASDITVTCPSCREHHSLGSLSVVE